MSNYLFYAQLSVKEVKRQHPSLRMGSTVVVESDPWADLVEASSTNVQVVFSDDTNGGATLPASRDALAELPLLRRPLFHDTAPVI